MNLPQGEEKPGCGLKAVSCWASVSLARIINQVSEMSLNPFSRITVAATRHFLPLPSLFPTPSTSFLFRFFARFVSLTECNIHSCTLVTTPGLAGGESSASSLKSTFESPLTVESESLSEQIKEKLFQVLSRHLSCNLGYRDNLERGHRLQSSKARPGAKPADGPRSRL